MAAKGRLHQHAEEPEGEPKDLLDDLSNAADRDGDPLNEDELKSVRRGLADVAAGRVISLEEFERDHPA